MNKKVAKIISKILTADRLMHIKLLGDSITHGVGGSGFLQDGEPIVGEFSRNKNGNCWAKKFKDYMETHYNCVITNNACTGTKIEFIIDNFERLVDDEDDIIICAIGTNNRHQFLTETPLYTREEHMQNFYSNILKLNNMFKSKCKDVIFVANIPASSENEKDTQEYLRLFHMNDVNDIYMKASEDYGFAFISLYLNFLEYCELKDITVDSLLADGLHPNDNGHEVIFKIMLRELGIK